MRIEVHGDQEGKLCNSFKEEWRRQCKALDIELDLGSGVPEVGSATPRVAVVFPTCGDAWSASDKTMLPAYKDAGFPVLPVIINAPEASFLPESLEKINAFQRGIWNEAWPAGLVDEVLSLGWQRRRERRVFISYKRTDSGPVAQQLHSELTRRGYLAFLDDVSIRKGDDFQRELKWWLNDADVVLVLATPNFENSRWCMEEIAFAQSSMIGLLGIEWPVSVFGDRPKRAFPVDGARSKASGRAVLEGMDADQRIVLAESDFTGRRRDPLCEQTLDEEGLAKVLAYCARKRSQAVRLRLENLVPLAERLLQPKGTLKPAAAPGDFTFLDQDGTDCFVRLLPFRPDARSVHETFASAGGQSRIGCLYGEIDVNDPRAAAIRWLTDAHHEPSGSMPKQQTRLWACVGDNVTS